MNAEWNSLHGFSRRVFLTALVGTLAVAGSLKAEPAKYGEKQTVKMGTVISFPDFDLTDHGQLIAMLREPRICLWSREFEMSRAGKSVHVSCMTLPKALGPHPFEWNGKSFTLELKHSLAGVDEVVVNEK
jgi:hypothetical protein